MNPTLHETNKNEKLRELCYIGDLELVRKHVREHAPEINSQNLVNGW